MYTGIVTRLQDAQQQYMAAASMVDCVTLELTLCLAHGPVMCVIVLGGEDH